jgi:iron complex outermembrane receptor protein
MKNRYSMITMLTLAATALPFVSAAHAQEQVLEEVTVTGIRGSLASALEEKRSSNNLVEIIESEDVGKLPDQNLAEVLENVTGIQITRTAGVGTGVQIRGTNANRTEINGVSTVGSGSGRSGINFEDVSAAIIAAVEVTKAPDAKTIEGSVGGTINLRTIRPLDLEERVATIRVQAEDSSLSTDGATPRVSGTYGNNWTTDSGDFGVVISAGFSEQDVTAFRPRTDRDNFVAAGTGNDPASGGFLPIQFFVQDYDNYEYDTNNFAGTFEWSPNESLKFDFNAVMNDQERRQESSRIQASGISGNRNIYTPSAFETVNFGSVDSSNGTIDLGSVQAAVQGIIPIDADGSDGNLRFSGDTNSRLTESEIFSLGADWNRGALSGRVEVSSSKSDSSTPSFNTTLNFINPNSPLDYDALLANRQANIANAGVDGYSNAYDSNENGTPFAYDLTGGSLTFGVAQDAANGPTSAMLLDPANIVLRDVQQGQNVAENSENAFRTDFTYDLDWNGVTSVDFGFRHNKTSSLEMKLNQALA